MAVDPMAVTVSPTFPNPSETQNAQCGGPATVTVACRLADEPFAPNPKLWNNAVGGGGNHIDYAYALGLFTRGTFMSHIPNSNRVITHHQQRDTFSAHRLPTEMMANLTMVATLAAFLLLALLPKEASSFAAAPTRPTRPPPDTYPSRLRSRSGSDTDVGVVRGDAALDGDLPRPAQTRRSVLATAAAAALTTAAVPTQRANAALGTLPEFSDSNAIFQSLTIDVADKDQYDETIEFFTSAFDGMKVLRQRSAGGGGVVKDTVSFQMI